MKIKLNTIAAFPALAISLWKGPQVPVAVQLEMMRAVQGSASVLFVAACVLAAASRPEAERRIADKKTPLQNADMLFQHPLTAMYTCAGLILQGVVLAFASPVLRTFDILRDNPGPCRAACLFAVTLCLSPLAGAAVHVLAPLKAEGDRLLGLKKALTLAEARNSQQQRRDMRQG